MCVPDAITDDTLEAPAPTLFETGTGTRTGDMGERVIPVGIDAAAGITIEVTNVLRVMGRTWPPPCSVCCSWTDLGMLSAIEVISSIGAVMMIVRVATRGEF